MAPNRLLNLTAARPNQVGVTVATPHQLVAALSRKGNCYANAFIESFWSSLKYDPIYRHRFVTRAEARSVPFD